MPAHLDRVLTISCRSKNLLRPDADWAEVHLRDLIDGVVLLQICGQVSVAPGALVMLHHQQSDGSQYVCAQRQIEEHVHRGPHRLHARKLTYQLLCCQNH